MSSSATVALLYRISELARRHGLKPSEADASLHFECDDPERPEPYERLTFLNSPDDPEKEIKFNKMMSLLGCDEDNVLKTKRLSDMEEIVERAVAMSPRPRTL